jgi:hypothetical protein
MRVILRMVICGGLVAVAGAAHAEAHRALTADECATFNMQVSACWNVGALTPEARAVAVVVGFDMSQDGRPVRDSIALIEANSDDAAAAEQAFQAALRAIIRCGTDGYDLPRAAYARWQHMEITFDPTQVESR